MPVMEPRGALLFPQETATGLYPKPVESSQRSLSLQPILMLSSHLRLRLPSGLFYSGGFVLIFK
jgi:hypothetical protein